MTLNYRFVLLAASLAACNGGTDGGDTATTLPTGIADDGASDGGPGGDGGTAADGNGTADGGDGDGGTGGGSADGASADGGSADGGSTGATDGGNDTMPPSQPPVCGHQCTGDADCNIGGKDSGLTCLTGLCGFACTDDMGCIAAFSGWLNIPCTSNGDCSGGECVDIGNGTGGCSLTPSLGSCSDANLVETTATNVDGSTVTVCAQPGAKCGDFGGIASCFLGCTDASCGDASCGDDGLCHCDFDTQCIPAALGNNCNATTGLCEFACQTAADCPPAPYDGGTMTCQ